MREQIKNNGKREYERLELSNGIRVVHKPTPHTKIAHCALMLDIGSRDEKPHQQGIAHFWEHMAFKGTKKRKAFHIINRLEAVGGELNAYTTKEKICFYAAALDLHLEKAVDLLADITFHATFQDAQIDKERQVILEEMSMYKDSPEDAIQDEMDELLFKNHAMGNNILGTRESVRSFAQKDFLAFVHEHLDTSRVVFASVGNYSIHRLKKLVDKYLSPLPKARQERLRTAVHDYTPLFHTRRRDITQAHVGIGCRAFHQHTEQKIPFLLLNNILGGHAMNARLNLSLREKHGLVYHIESNFQAYSDTGAFTIFYATEPKNLDLSLRLIQKEIEQLRRTPLGDRQLQRAKEQIKGQLAMAEEQPQRLMLMMAKSTLDYDKIESLDMMFEKIDHVPKQELQALAQTHLNLPKMSKLKYLPLKG